VTEALGEIFTPRRCVRSGWRSIQIDDNGIAVTDVGAGSPAEKAGVREGDIVARVNGVTPKSVFILNREIIRSSDKKDVLLQLQRAGAVRSASVKLLPRTRSSTRNS
jgi:S1-C subfamily serine protease